MRNTGCDVERKDFRIEPGRGRLLYPKVIWHTLCCKYLSMNKKLSEEVVTQKVSEKHRR